ncbi:hypothetical protein F4V57_14270 [Acinetobacter qingfengensis]|uniref:Lipoprotein n=1 Tax=Acinetobacter qingfengensis TaxID=1262585 RepID=A0A1E7QYW7_9GAMM|nr:hypothetical protein [Acinetobacter qingfengensis]KAA8731014.1 hypothetical protein F4V57_14270 [Acinetobacter qingfengensis]OEY92206.1 hypothetical protein BJI46_05495 [Acinetobacter qingfengensis]
MKKILLMCLVVGLVGCVTAPVQNNERKPLSNDRILSYKEKTEINNSKIIVTRDSGFLGGGCYYGFWVDGKLTARFDTRETAEFFIPEGERVLRAGRDPYGKGLCAVDQSNWTQIETIVSPEKAKTFRLSLDLNGRPAIQREN